MDEIKNLHKEWFPLDYPDKFYAKVLNKSGIIAKGCFLNIYKHKKPVPIATIIGRVKPGKDDAQEIFRHILGEEEKE